MELSVPKLYLPMLSGLMLGEAMSDHDGVRCYPAIRHTNQEKYIVKVISVPASLVQLDALLLTGAFPNREAALDYYMDVARDMLRETDILRQLSHQEGFIPYLDAQIISNDDLTGYEVYLLNNFRLSVERIFETEELTHKQIIHMGLDLCAALTACRREGYIYVDLKPANIYYTEGHGYRIGDVGFASISSLAYASLPEKYRSRYTAPELLDEMAVLNDTVDVYALGLVLYQAYNGGQLPEMEPGQTLPAPLYADYEFTDIILKACHPEASKRWTNPMELAQAIIGYIQRNNVSEKPIIPPVVTDEPAEMEDFLPEADSEELRKEMDQLEDAEFQDIDTLSDSQTDGESNGCELSSTSEDISEILAQADELIAHQLPEPPVAPAPIEVPMPERIQIDEIVDTVEEKTEDIIEAIPETPEIPECQQSTQPVEEPPQSKTKEKKTHTPLPKRRFPWKAVAVCLLVVALISAGMSGYYYYQNIYLQQVDELVLEQNGSMLSVKVVGPADQSLLTVICSDSYGNTIRKNVTAGIALFTDLDPQTHYSLYLEVSGFHKLIGHISDSFTTDAQTQITNLSASIGNKDGSVLISFDTNGPNVKNWIVSYSAPGIKTQQTSFQGKFVQISNLQIGAEYTFTLSREDGQDIAGQTQVQYTASNIVLAQGLTVTACANGNLTVQWDTPGDIMDILWNVRCYNTSGYDQTITTSDLSATFTGLTHDVACTIEVTAEGMPRSVSVIMEANPITVEQFHLTVTDEGMIEVIWDYFGIVTDGWILEYTIDNAPMQTLTLSENTAMLLLIPGGSYTITVTAIDATYQFGGNCNYVCPDAEKFLRWGISADNLHAALCIRPNSDHWIPSEVSEDQFVSNFTANQKIGLVLRSDLEPQMADEMVTIRFIFYNSDGTLLYVFEENVSWCDIWAGNICGLNIPWLPNEIGVYRIYLYFADQYVTELTFSVSETE